MRGTEGDGGRWREWFLINKHAGIGGYQEQRTKTTRQRLSGVSKSYRHLFDWLFYYSKSTKIMFDDVEI